MGSFAPRRSSVLNNCRRISTRNRAPAYRTCSARTPTIRRSGCSLSSCAAATARRTRSAAATLAKAKQLFGDKGAMDLVAVMSTYTVSGLYAIAVDEHVAAGQPTLPAVAAH